MSQNEVIVIEGKETRLAPHGHMVQGRLPVELRIIQRDYGLSEGKWFVLIDAIFPSAKSADSVLLALDYCRARGLDPFKRPVHIVPVWDKDQGKYVETVWLGVNGILTEAARTGKFAGVSRPEWGEDVTRDFLHEADPAKVPYDESRAFTFPESCTVSVYRIVDGQRCEFPATVYWEESYATQGRSPLPNQMWQKRRRGQLHKCALSAALRMAFPESADYSAEEMEGQSGSFRGAVIEGAATEKKPEQNQKAQQAQEKPEPGKEPQQQDKAPEPSADGAPPKRGRGRPAGSRNKATEEKQEPAKEPEKKPEPEKPSREQQADESLRQAAAQKERFPNPEAPATQSSEIVYVDGKGNRHAAESLDKWAHQWGERASFLLSKGQAEQAMAVYKANEGVLLDLLDAHPDIVDGIVEKMAKVNPAITEEWESNFADGGEEDEIPM